MPYTRRYVLHSLRLLRIYTYWRLSGMCMRHKNIHWLPGLVEAHSNEAVQLVIRWSRGLPSPTWFISWIRAAAFMTRGSYWRQLYCSCQWVSNTVFWFLGHDLIGHGSRTQTKWSIIDIATTGISRRRLPQCIYRYLASMIRTLRIILLVCIEKPWS